MIHYRPRGIYSHLVDLRPQLSSHNFLSNNLFLTTIADQQHSSFSQLVYSTSFLCTSSFFFKSNPSQTVVPPQTLPGEKPLKISNHRCQDCITTIRTRLLRVYFAFSKLPDRELYLGKLFLYLLHSNFPILRPESSLSSILLLQRAFGGIF